MRRTVVLGGRGHFGSLLVERLRSFGLRPAVASRRSPAALRLDAEDGRALRAALRRGDVVLDAAGPFQARTGALVEAAVEVGFDVIDLADSAAYVERVRSLAPAALAAGVRLFTACSSVSTVTAALVRRSGIPEPTRVTAFLVPAARRTARPATVRSFLRSLGAPVAALRGGRLVRLAGWSEERVLDLPAPWGRVRCRLVEGADAVTLPPLWPSLSEVEFVVSPGVPGAGALLRWAARSPRLRRALERSLPQVLPVARALGRSSGAFGAEVEGRGVRRRATLLGELSHRMAVLPAALAARDLARGRAPPAGVVPPDRHCDEGELFDLLRREGVVEVRQSDDVGSPTSRSASSAVPWDTSQPAQ